MCCLGNYKEFTERAAPQDMFMQSPESVIGLGDTVTLPPHDAAVYQHEAELVIVIGQASNVYAASGSFGDLRVHLRMRRLGARARQGRY